MSDMKEFAEKLMEPSRKKYEGITMSTHEPDLVEGARKGCRCTKEELREIIRGDV